MYKISRFIVNHTKSIITVFLILMAVGGILSTGVGMNLDNTSYLPDTMNSKEAVVKLGEEFGMKGTANVLIEGKEIYEIQELKKKILDVSGVNDVIWLDDFIDVNTPIEFIDKKYIDQFYKDGNALLQVLFTDINESEITHNALSEIESLLQEDTYLSGPSVMSKNMITRSNNEVKIYTVVAVTLVLIILLASTASWLEPFIFILTIGISILMNMGLNILKGEVSQVTYSAASILQFAVSMDYMIFLLHRFHDERRVGTSVKEAMISSIMLSYKPIMASAITTIAGFLALTFMDFGIGKDLGLVLARGVFLSLITVLTFLPAIVILLEKWINRFSHKEISPKFQRISKISSKGRYIFVILVFVFAYLFYMAQTNVNYYYDNNNALPKDDPSFIAKERIDAHYGSKNQNIIIIPSGDKLKELELVQELEDLPYVTKAFSLHSETGTELPEMMIPDTIKDNFSNDNFSMINLDLSTGKEDEAAFIAVDRIRTIVSDYYDEYYVAGEPFSYKDLKDVTDSDFSKINILSIVFIIVILGMTFKSLSIPIIAVFIIETAIWINVGIAYFLDSSMSFISFVIIGAIQLGATVDYAILYISRYKENLISLPPLKAATETIKNTAKSILISGGILVTATFTIYFIASMRTASELCLLIGRGAIISMISVFFALPGFLVVFEPIIKRTSLDWPTNTTNEKIKLRGVENEI